MRIAICALAAIVAAAAPTRAVAQEFTGRRVQILVLELTGHFTPDREQATAGGADAVNVLVGGRTRWFSAVLARTTGYPPPVAGRTVLAALAPIQPNLIARGDRDLATRLAEAPDGVTLHMEGVVDRGSRTYLLRRVDLPPPPP